MTSPETTAARNRVSLALQELERAQASLASAQASEYSDALQLIGSVTLDAGQKSQGATLVDARQILQTALGNVLVILQGAGFLPAAVDVAPATDAPTEGEPEPDAEPTAA